MSHYRHLKPLPFVLASVAVSVGLVGGSLAVTRPRPSVAVANQQPRPTETSAPPSVAPSTAPPSPSARSTVRLAFAGDVQFINGMIAGLAEDPTGYLDPIAKVLGDADASFVNLETAITSRGEAAVKEFVFRAPFEGLVALREAGVEAVSLANNHTLDFGEVGFRDTLDAVKQAGLVGLGGGLTDEEAYSAGVIEIADITIAVVAATDVLPAVSWEATAERPGIASAKNVEHLAAVVAANAKTADVVIVYLHWGEEKALCPNQRQRDLVAAMKKAGAAAIIGEHAHRVQGMGYDGSTFVAYGLGNFVWNATSALSAETGVLTLEIDKQGVSDWTWTPAQINNGVPTPMPDIDPEAVLAQRQDCAELTNAPS